MKLLHEVTKTSPDHLLQTPRVVRVLTTLSSAGSRASTGHAAPDVPRSGPSTSPGPGPLDHSGRTRAASNQVLANLVPRPTQHHPVFVDERLPAALRDSKLPWAPDLEHQSPAPAPNDSWCALVGTLEWSLHAHQDAPDAQPVYMLGLRDIARDEDLQHFFKSYPSPDLANSAAEAVHDMLLEQLRLALENPS